MGQYPVCTHVPDHAQQQRRPHWNMCVGLFATRGPNKPEQISETPLGGTLIKKEPLAGTPQRCAHLLIIVDLWVCANDACVRWPHPYNKIPNTQEGLGPPTGQAVVGSWHSTMTANREREATTYSKRGGPPEQTAGDVV